MCRWKIAVDARRIADELRADCCIAWGGGLDDRARQGDRAHFGPAGDRGADDVFRLGDDCGRRHDRGRIKKTQRDPRMLPKTVVYDPELTLGLPAATSAQAA
jgi:hypothetical protein